jgi:hypothetical protein
LQQTGIQLRQLRGVLQGKTGGQVGGQCGHEGSESEQG